MSGTRRLRRPRIIAVGALTAAGAAAVALLASPIASSYAETSFGGPKGLTGTYPNGGFCYQSRAGSPNTYRLQVSEPRYDPNSSKASLLFEVQKWDNSSNQYHDERTAFTADIDKLVLGGDRFKDANVFCATLTGSHSGELGGDAYGNGEWTSTRTID
jgi:hypothetical protein